MAKQSLLWRCVDAFNYVTALTAEGRERIVNGRHNHYFVTTWTPWWLTQLRKRRRERAEQPAISVAAVQVAPGTWRIDIVVPPELAPKILDFKWSVGASAPL